MRAWLATVGLVLAGMSVGVSGCGSAGDSEPRSATTGRVVTPLRDFVAQLDAAGYADYAGRPGVTVRDEAAFEEMRRYLVERYQTADAAGTVTLAGVVFDCLRVADPGAASTAADPGGCPEGRVPVRRVTLDDLVRFRTLADFLGKGPGPEGVPPESP